MELDVDIETRAPSLAALRERVSEELRERIVSGRLRPGDRLVERELAADLGVSRVPVREAIRMLQSEGFVVAPSPRRIVVRQLSRDDVLELFDVREALEVFAAGRAAERATPAQVTRIGRLLEQAARATRGGRADRISQLNDRFHDEIIAIAGNSLLTTMLEPLHDRLRWLTRHNTDWDRLLGEHRRLYEAIASREPERARQVSLEHVRINREVILALFPAEPGAGAAGGPR